MKYLKLFESSNKDILESILSEVEDVLQDLVDREQMIIRDSFVTDDYHWFQKHHTYNLYNVIGTVGNPIPKDNFRKDGENYIRLILDVYKGIDWAANFDYFKGILAPVMKRISVKYGCDMYIGFSVITLSNGAVHNVCNLFIQPAFDNYLCVSK